MDNITDGGIFSIFVKWVLVMILIAACMMPSQMQFQADMSVYNENQDDKR